MKNAYQSYESVRKSLQNGDNINEITELSSFISHPEFKSNEELLTTLIGTVFQPEVLYVFLRDTFAKIISNAVREGRKRTGHLAWAAGVNGRAAYIAYIRTKQTRFLDLYVEFFNQLLSVRDDALGNFDDYHGRIMTSWGSSGESLSKKKAAGLWISHVTHFCMLMQPATSIARLIREDPNLSGYSDFATDVVELFSSAYREFDSDIRQISGTHEIWFWRPFKEQFEATNHIHLQGEALLNMYSLEYKSFYGERIESFIRTFERSARIDDHGFVAWGYHPYFSETPLEYNPIKYSESSWKASFTVPFIYLAKQQGFSIDQDIVEATTKTIREHVVANNGYSSNLNPNGSVSFLERMRKPKSGRPGPPSSIVGYLWASIEDPQIKELIRNIVATRRDLFPEGWLKPSQRRPLLWGQVGYAFMMESK